jgi:antitoxin component of RelBE/YafQ-DinJ toxin-antitoxin module
MSTESLVVFSAKVKPDIKAQIYKVAEEKGLTINEALSFIIAQANKPAPEPVTVTEKVFSDDELLYLKSMVQDDVAEISSPNEHLIYVITELLQLRSKVLLLENRPPETITVEKEVQVQVPIALQKNQFIVTLPDQEANDLRKCRPFMVKDGRITAKTEPSDMVTLFVRTFLDAKYDHVLNPNKLFKF